MGISRRKQAQANLSHKAGPHRVLPPPALRFGVKSEEKGTPQVILKGVGVGLWPEADTFFLLGPPSGCGFCGSGIPVSPRPLPSSAAQRGASPPLFPACAPRPQVPREDEGEGRWAEGPCDVASVRTVWDTILPPTYPHPELFSLGTPTPPSSLSFLWGSGWGI